MIFPICCFSFTALIHQPIPINPAIRKTHFWVYHVALISDKSGCYFVTFSVIHWIDIFSIKEYRDIVVDSLNYCIKEKELNVYGWVIMSNHIHLIITSKTEKGNLTSIIRDFKKFTSKAISKAIQEIPESRIEWLLNAMSKEAENFRATYYKCGKMIIMR